MTAAPDVAGLLDALSALPDRAPEQLRAYALQRDGLRWARGTRPEEVALAAEQKRNEAIELVLTELESALLGEEARRAIAAHLSVKWPYD